MAWLGLLLKVLNPLNWFKVASAINAIISAGETVIRFIKEWQKSRELERKKKGAADAAAELKKASEIEDDDARLKAKADALCRLEKKMDPSSTCDVDDGSSELPDKRT